MKTVIAQLADTANVNHLSSSNVNTMSHLHWQTKQLT